MPTKKELRTLVYCSNGIPQQEAWDNWCSGKNNKGGGNYQRPTINQKAFPNVYKYSIFWSSSPVADSSGSAWYVNFNYGNDNASYKVSNRQVRLVRSGQ